MRMANRAQRRYISTEQTAQTPSLASSELRTARCHRLLEAAYRIRRYRRWPPTGTQILSLALRLEGGDMFSATARQLMSEFHGIHIGAYAYGCFDPWRFPSGVSIGRYASIGPEVQVYRRNHPLDRLSLHPFFYNPHLGISETDAIDTIPLEIGADVWIGARALILSGCRQIGCGAVIGAGAVVTRDVPAFALVAGNPARIVKMRFSDDLCDRVLASRWWERSIKDMADILSTMQISLEPTHPLIKNAQLGQRDGRRPPVT